MHRPQKEVSFAQARFEGRKESSGKERTITPKSSSVALPSSAKQRIEVTGGIFLEALGNGDEDAPRCATRSFAFPTVRTPQEKEATDGQYGASFPACTFARH